MKMRRVISSRPSEVRASAKLKRAKTALALLLSVALGACSSLGASGPRGSAIRNAGELSYAESGVQIVDLNDTAISRIAMLRQSSSFAEVFGDGAVNGTVIGNGDIVDIAIWEAPPAVLFGVARSDTRLVNDSTIAQSGAIPQQMVGDEGTITVPFAGSLRVTGRTPNQVEREIVSRLRGKAHDPQVVVRLVQNEARNVTVIGAVATSRRLPLSAKGERLLDALASAGGPKEPVDKTTIQIARGMQTATMPLEVIIRNPEQNVRLQPDDVVTVLFQPYSFIALGAVTRSAEVPFEGSGISLAQAMGRIGGLREDRADVRGVFVFRMEVAAALDPAVMAKTRTTADGRVPVIYQLNFADPASIFAARDFAIQDDDVIYVSTALGADLQRFLATLSSVAFSAIAIGNSVK